MDEEKKQQVQQQPQQAREEEKKQPKPKKEKKPKAAASNVSKAAEELDDLDFLDAVISENKKCTLSSCPTNIELFFCMCKSCKKRFCALHFHEDKHFCEDLGKPNSNFNNFNN